MIKIFEAEAAITYQKLTVGETPSGNICFEIKDRKGVCSELINMSLTDTLALRDALNKHFPVEEKAVKYDFEAMKFDRDKAAAALDDCRRVAGAFDWIGAPQGYVFWLSFYNGENQSEGQDALRDMIAQWDAEHGEKSAGEKIIDGLHEAIESTKPFTLVIGAHLQDFTKLDHGDLLQCVYANGAGYTVGKTYAVNHKCFVNNTAVLTNNHGIKCTNTRSRFVAVGPQKTITITVSDNITVDVKGVE